MVVYYELRRGRARGWMDWWISRGVREGDDIVD